MDTALGLFDFVTAHLGSIVTLAFALCGLLAQAAALFNLTGLVRFSSTLHDIVQFLAGNWGAASNAVRIVQLYRTAGPAAALGELAVLAKDLPGQDGRGPLPPGATPVSP